MTEIIINADDYGLNRHCTDAIKECFSRKLITSTTVMATGMCFDQAIIIARENGFSDKFVVKGEVKTMADESYTSHNTNRLDVQGTVDKIMTTEYVKNALAGIPNV